MTHTPRRIRRIKQQWSHPLWHLVVHSPGLTYEQAAEIKTQFLAAQKRGIAVTPPEIEIRRIGPWR